MVKLVRVEKFSGSGGVYWKPGDKGSATMFSSWVRSFIRENTSSSYSVGDKTKNSSSPTISTSREFVTNDGGYETLNISFGRKDMLPLDIQVKVKPEESSIINLRYREKPTVAKWVDQAYTIKNPLSLSIDPSTKKLISVVFKGPQFSFYKQKSSDPNVRGLAGVTGYGDALAELERPMKKAVEIIKKFEEETLKSRDLTDFNSLPEVQELKDTYYNWSMDVDTSKLASQNKVTYLFTHPTNPNYNFTVCFKDEGGSDYKCYATLNGSEMNLDNLYKKLKGEIAALSERDDIIDYDDNISSGSGKDSNVSKQNLVGVIFRENKKLVALLDLLDTDRSGKWEVKGDFSKISLDNMEVVYSVVNNETKDKYTIVAGPKTLSIQKDGKNVNLPAFIKIASESYVKEMTSSGFSSLSFLKGKDKKDKDKFDKFIKRIGVALEDPSLSKTAVVDITPRDDGSEDWELILKTQHGMKSVFWKVTPDGKVDSFSTDFGYNSSLSGVPLISEKFFDEITKAAEKFLEEYGAYNNKIMRLSGTDIEHGWISGIEQPAYDMANWADRVVDKVTPELDALIDKYNLDLNRDVKTDFVNDFDRDRSRTLVYSGSYLDKVFNTHLLELRLAFDRGDRFTVWIRPDLKGSKKDKKEGQSDLSFFKEWVEENVSLRSSKPDSSSFREAILSELKRLGALDGSIKGTVTITNGKFKDLVLDVKVSNNKVITSVYKDGSMITQVEMDMVPFSDTPTRVAKMILTSVKKQTKESFLVSHNEDREYWNSLFSTLTSEGVLKRGDVLVYNGKSCRVRLGSLGNVTLQTMTGKPIAEEVLNQDIRFISKDKDLLIKFLNENRAKF